MKNLVFVSLLLATPAFAQTKLSIVEFENKANSGDCRFDGWAWWNQNLGSAFKEMLVGEIKKHSRFKLYERATIRKVYENEHDLVNSENAPKKAKGQFQVADFTLAGSVSEFEYCSSGRTGGIRLGGLGILNDLSIGGETQEAKVVVDIRVINTETGEITATTQGEGTVKDGKLDLGVSLGPVSTNLGGHEGTPIAKAARLAIHNATNEIVSRIP